MDAPPLPGQAAFLMPEDDDAVDDGSGAAALAASAAEAEAAAAAEAAAVADLIPQRRSRRTVKVPDRYDPDSLAHEPIFCLCRGVFKRGQFMVQCDSCKEWFHGACVSVQPEVRAAAPAVGHGLVI